MGYIGVVLGCVDVWRSRLLRGGNWGPARFCFPLVWERGGGFALRAPTTALRQLFLFGLDTGHFSDLCGSGVSHNDGSDQGPSRRAPPLHLPPVGAFAFPPLLSKKNNLLQETAMGGMNLGVSWLYSRRSLLGGTCRTFLKYLSERSLNTDPV